jgi:hypothetical protein
MKVDGELNHEYSGLNIYVIDCEVKSLTEVILVEKIVSGREGFWKIDL